ncbi:MAG: 4-alpha-glucanotransferase [Terrimicrobiaceae bacterium]|nr:4-alpha-glucanotransferase [Terrimicrobiaceae bacterium]
MPDLSPDQRIAGVLAPVFALRGSQDLGIGDTLALREFATWAARHGLRVVQILPVNESGADNSPYNIISSMALDPTTIATFPDELPDLRKADFKRITAGFDLRAMRAASVRYAEVKKLKRALLAAAHATFCETADAERQAAFDDFIHQHDEWLTPYSLYRALVTLHGESEVLCDWPERQRTLPGALEWIETLTAENRHEIERLSDFHRYVQWIAFTQWQAVRDHCERLGVSLMGDVPVGVSVYSCDVWSEPGVFDLTRSSGAPPEKVFKSDPFTEQWGQNWGFPLYDWFAMSRDDFAWWRRRLRAMVAMFDLIRVDHALGFFRIYSFPWRPERNAEFLDLTEDEAKALTGGRLPGFMPRDDSTPDNEEQNRRHGEVLFKLMLEEIAAPRLIAEDLGVVPPYVRPVLERLEIPGFKIPQWEREPGCPLTPGGTYPRLSLATYATHDHPPVHTFWNAWFALTKSSKKAEALHAREEMDALLAFCGELPLEKPHAFDSDIHAVTMRGLMAANSWLAIPMITDILGTEDRFNVPGAIGDQNWTARLATTAAGIDRNHRLELKLLRQILTQTGRMAK